MAPDQLWALHRLGLKLVPLFKSGVPAIKWRPLFDTPCTDEQFTEEVVNRVFTPDSQIYAVATTFGLSHVTHEQGRKLYLHCLDIDSQTIYEILDGLRDPETGQSRSAIKWLLENTYCTATHKTNGLHCYWFSHVRHPPIHTDDMLDSDKASFEIKSDKTSGLATLAPSPHRTYREFRYEAIGRTDRILVDDSLYGRFLAVFQHHINPSVRYSSEVLEFIPEHKLQVARPQPLSDYFHSIHNNTRSSNNFRLEPLPLSEETINAYVNKFQRYIKRGRRNEFYMKLSGWLLKRGIAFESAYTIVARLVSISHDEERLSRFSVLRETYKKQPWQVNGGFVDFTNFLRELAPPGDDDYDDSNGGALC